MWPFRRREERALPPGALLTYPGGSGSPTWAAGPGGGVVDSDAALRLPAVWACVRLLADTISTLPVDVYRAGELVTTPRLLVEPAAGQALSEWLYSVMASLLLRGNAYGLITARTGPGLHPAQVELVHPDLVGVHTDPTTGMPTYRVGGRPYDRSQLWHVRAYTLPGVLLGMSPVEYARQAIGLGLATEKFGASYFGYGAIPTGTLRSDNPDLTQEEADAAKAAWMSAQATRTPAVLNSTTHFEALTIRPDEAQFVETSRFNVAQIARVFGVPAEMVGGDQGGSLTYSNTEARALDYVRYCVGPWLVRLEEALTRLVPAGQRVKLNVDGLLRATTRERYEAHEIALRAGFLTVDEVRELEDRPPLPAQPAVTGPRGVVA